ncbi:hypothetical protein AAG906_003616 [Vitis piasezkii]
MDLFPTSCFLKDLFGSTRAKHASSCTTGCPDKWSKHAPPKLKLDKSSSSYLWERAVRQSSQLRAAEGPTPLGLLFCFSYSGTFSSLFLHLCCRYACHRLFSIVFVVILKPTSDTLPLTKELSLLTLISPFASSFSVPLRIDSGLLSYHRHAGRTGAIFLLSIGTAKQWMGWVTDSNNCVIPCKFPRDPNLLSMSQFATGLRLPLLYLFKQFFHFTQIPLALLHPNVVRVLMGCSILNMLFQLDLSLLEVLFVYTMKRVKKGGHLVEWVEKASFTWLNKLFEIDVSE